MMNGSGIPADSTLNRTLRRFTGFFYGAVGAAIVLALTILVLSGEAFLALSNYLQILVAMAAACVCIYLWFRCGKRETHLYAAGAFGIWGISNIAWYVNVFLGQRNAAFPSLIDMGMIASLLLMGIAIQKGLTKKPVAPHILLGILALCLIVPVGVLIATGPGLSSLVSLLYFFACGSLIIIGVNHGPGEHRFIVAGAILFALAFMVYPLREMFFVTIPALSIIGTFVSAGFALIAIGLLSLEIRD